MAKEYGMVFKYAPNEDGYIQCTINFKYRKDFEKLGFVGSVDQIKKPGRKKVIHDDNNQGQSD